MINPSNISFYFDLDRTIWNTYDKYEQPIWARQMIAPYTFIDKYTIQDDCLSICKLDPDIVDFFKLIKLHKISYISRGGNLNVTYDEQPSVKLLKLFNIHDVFSANKILIHKNQIKHEHMVLNGKKVIFIDDSKEELEKMKNAYPSITCINRESFINWKDIKL